MAATERFEMRVPAEQMVLLRQAALDAKESMTMFVLTAALNRAQGAPEIMPAVEKAPKVHASPKPAQKVVEKVQKTPSLKMPVEAEAEYEIPPCPADVKPAVWAVVHGKKRSAQR